MFFPNRMKSTQQTVFDIAQHGHVRRNERSSSSQAGMLCSVNTLRPCCGWHRNRLFARGLDGVLILYRSTDTD
jgi:hypothetical protein